ncbi:MAG: ABC transporter permease [Rhodocyclaceae bacterium]|nr:ABC transporter permease [Rhodocyclaceae bacterium]
MLFRLALRNIFRQRVRTAITLSAIVFGVVGLILSSGFIQDIFVQLGEAIIHSQTGHVQVFRKDFLQKGSRKPEQFLIENVGDRIKSMQDLPEVTEVTARLNFAGLLNNGRRDIAIIGEGVEPDKEARLGSYLMITSGRQLTDRDTFGILLGQGVAAGLGLSPGDPVTVLTNTGDGTLNSLEFEVIGVFQSFSKDYDARAIRIPLAAAQELLVSEGANLLVVTLSDTRLTQAGKMAIDATLSGSDLESKSWRELSDFYDKTVQLYDRQFGILQFIILVMVLLSVVNSVNMSAFERQGEFGTLLALGNRPRDVFTILLAENLILGALGATIGFALGVVLGTIISAVGIPMPPPPNANVGYTAQIRLVPVSLITAWAIGFIATVCAVLFPARRIARTPIVDALRQAT